MTRSWVVAFATALVCVALEGSRGFAAAESADVRADGSAAAGGNDYDTPENYRNMGDRLFRGDKTNEVCVRVLERVLCPVCPRTRAQRGSNPRQRGTAVPPHPRPRAHRRRCPAPHTVPYWSSSAGH